MQILFLKYEEMKEDIVPSVRKLAEFMGFPFSIEDEKLGVIQEISKLCTIDKIKNVEAHKNGKHVSSALISAFFRKGAVGNWRNYLKLEMAQRLEKIVQDKLSSSV